MGVAVSISPPGGAPKPDPARVAAIRYTIVDEPETCVAFGESARAALASLNDRALAETRTGDLGECRLLLDHIRDHVAGLDPARLVPRSGLAGLFDSRSKRLKAFRAGYASADSAVTQAAADIGERVAVLARRDTALETLWSETREAIAELDAHIVAARSWLANEAVAPVMERVAESAAPEPAGDALQPVETIAEAGAEFSPAPVDGPVEALGETPEAAGSGAEVEPEVEADAGGSAPVLSEAVESPETVVLTDVAEPVDVVELAAEASAEPEPETAPEPEAELQSDPDPEPVHTPAPVASLPHPLETRLTALEALRATAIGRLPLLRAAQNADCRTPTALKQVCDGVEAWRADWQDALGLAGKRPKKITPDRVRLSQATSALTDRIDAAGRALSAAQGRRAELDARVAPAQTTIALAA
ncbi:toxic anion resistance protein [Brevundimonas sp.]|uniref:toxic anion resistance protein n=1 Tax=Brevundimonas sp. TaxID=1871086 RepID=UPI00286AF00F|nr:toxic anion resistance protein [Brevundimonas sp.]